MTYDPTTKIQISYTTDKQPYRDERTTYTITANRDLSVEQAITILQAVKGKVWPAKADAAWYQEHIERAWKVEREKVFIVINDPYKD